VGRRIQLLRLPVGPAHATHCGDRRGRRSGRDGGADPRRAARGWIRAERDPDRSGTQSVRGLLRDGRLAGSHADPQRGAGGDRALRTEVRPHPGFPDRHVGGNGRRGIGAVRERALYGRGLAHVPLGAQRHRRPDDDTLLHSRGARGDPAARQSGGDGAGGGRDRRCASTPRARRRRFRGGEPQTASCLGNDHRLPDALHVWRGRTPAEALRR